MKSLDEVASYFQNAKWEGKRYSAKCPCHNDKRNSLSIAIIENGIGVYDYAGCDTRDILRAVGLTMGDLTKDEIVRSCREQWEHDRSAKKSKKTIPRKKEPMGEIKTAVPLQPVQKQKTPANSDQLRVGGVYKRRVGDEYIAETITAAYDYTDQEGRPIMRVCRTDAKSFPTIHKDKDGWFWGDGGHTDALYRLPEVLRAVKAGQPIYIVEGEKDVDNLRALGYTATTNKGGAGKWPAAQTAKFEGAVVYIVPDNDEPGRKHGRLLLQSLKAVAREVRIVNLTRQDTAEIPEKGDVSDLISRLGEVKARQVLEELVARSPVLSRRVRDGEYMDYYQGVDGCTIRSSCTYGFSGDKSERKLADFVALPVEQVLIDDGSDSDDYATTAERMQGRKYEWAVDGWSSSGHRLRRIRLGAEEFEGMKWPMRYWGLDAIVTDGNGVSAKLLRFIKAAGAAAAVRRTVYTHTGWREIDGRMCFLHGGGAIGADGVDVRLEMGLNRYCLDGLRGGELMEMDRQAARPFIQAATVQALGVVPLRISVPIVGYLFLAPLTHFLKQRGLRPRVIPFVRGKTGFGKTTYVSLILNHFGSGFSYAMTQPASFEDSAPSMEKKLYILKDMPLYVDDWKSVADAKKMSVRRCLMENIIRMVCDGLKRSRMSAEMTARRDFPARSLCMMSGEELPGETGDSNIARLFVVNIEPDDIPLPTSNAPKEKKEAMDDLWNQAREGVLAENMRSYIEWLASIADELPDRLEEMYHRLYSQARQYLGKNVPHARLPDAAAYLMMGICMMLEYMRQPSGLYADMDEETMSGLMDTYWRALVENSARQAELMRTQTPTQVFISTLREEIQSGRAILLTMGDAQKLPPQGMVGYKDGEHAYLIPGVAVGMVARSLDAQKSSLPVGKTTLLRQLKEEGISITGGIDQTTIQVKRGNVHGRFLVLPLRLLQEGPPEEKQMSIVDAPENPFFDENKNNKR